MIILFHIRSQIKAFCSIRRQLIMTRATRKPWIINGLRPTLASHTGSYMDQHNTLPLLSSQSVHRTLEALAVAAVEKIVCHLHRFILFRSRISPIHLISGAISFSLASARASSRMARPSLRSESLGPCSRSAWPSRRWALRTNCRSP